MEGPFLARDSGALEVTFFPVVSFTFPQAFPHIFLYSINIYIKNFPVVFSMFPQAFPQILPIFPYF